MRQEWTFKQSPKANSHPNCYLGLLFFVPLPDDAPLLFGLRQFEYLKEAFSRRHRP